MCVCALCACVIVRGSCSTTVIYSGGLWPYLFSISLMLGSGFPPALPWPTGRRVWVDPSKTAWNQHHRHTHALPSTFVAPLLSLTLFLSSQTLANILAHKHTPTLKLIHSGRLSFFVLLFLLLSCARSPSADASFKHSVTCKHANILTGTPTHTHVHTHTLWQTITHAHMDCIQCPFPAPTTTVFFVLS